MQIKNLHISNFRGITDVSLRDLGTMVVIAGQNGSGKSCIFDAIRLLKSVYGGYQQNEWQQWMGEFQINLAGSDFTSMFNNEDRELRITCDFSIAEDERNFIIENAHELLRESTWRVLLPEAYQWGGLRMAAFATQFREREPEVAAKVNELLPKLMAELSGSTIRGEFFIAPRGQPQIVNSISLGVIFSIFRPEEIGVIDYHGAQRHYGRESVQGINLNLDAAAQQRSQSALYNYGAKYNNVKSEMAASYLKELLAEKAGVDKGASSTLSETLVDLFQTFFPEKQFLGPQPTLQGALTFPVRTITGALHDLDELSAGEKEILYGYLRIRNSAPRYSIILLDEPELHLNPRLIRGLPRFYRKNLGEALGNQIWLVTHSDALLREVVGNENYNVFHMLPCGAVPTGDSQLKPLSATADLEAALVDLVGDLAAYHPSGKVVIFEGGGDSDFDQRMTAALFPELSQKANLISGTNKVRVRALHETLTRLVDVSKIPYSFYSITDRDSDSKDSNESVNSFQWDVYHIENFFLNANYLRVVLASLGQSDLKTDDEVYDSLRECARGRVDYLIRRDLACYANDKILSAINTKTDPAGKDMVVELSDAVKATVARIQGLDEVQLGREALELEKAIISARYENSLEDGTWVKEFPGREILRTFVGRHVKGVPYEPFRNLVLSRMRDDGYRPEGMARIVNLIVEAA